MISIIGIGPGGSAASLTQEALDAIRSAEAGMYVGEMIGSEIKALFAPERLRTGRIPESDVLAALELAASLGTNFALLVPGDPSLYSGQRDRERSLGQYVEWLRSRGFAHRVLPGISSWQALCARIGLDMTDPSRSQSVFVTSVERLLAKQDSQQLASTSIESVLRLRPTLVLFQSYRDRKEILSLLRTHYPPTTEVVLGYKVSWPGEERIVRRTLAELDLDKLGDEMLKHTLMIVLSEEFRL